MLTANSISYFGTEYPWLNLLLAVVLILGSYRFILEPLFGISRLWRQPDDSPSPSNTPPVRHTVTLYSGGEKVDSWEVDDYDTSSGVVTWVSGNELETNLSGTCVILPVVGNSDSSNAFESGTTLYKVVLYDAGKEIGRWITDDWWIEDGGIYFGVENSDFCAFAKGTFVIEPCI